MRFLADNLSPKQDESSRETIRRYLCDSFFKDHLQTYKNRPIYWCFTSGKQKAFQCLVYLHRYNEGTLARMRMEYVVPLQSKMAARIDKLGDDIQAASTSPRPNGSRRNATSSPNSSTSYAALTSSFATTPTSASPWTWTTASRSTTASSVTCWPRRKRSRAEAVKSDEWRVVSCPGFQPSSISPLTTHHSPLTTYYRRSQ